MAVWLAAAPLFQTRMYQSISEVGGKEVIGMRF